MKITISAVAIFLCLACPTFAMTDYGMPFGDITDASVEEFGIFTKKNGLDGVVSPNPRNLQYDISESKKRI
ncbi:MAG: hypothetical protein J0665_02855 [Deltaproteobacteria bacterium]|nr:hypothetical protein [Deltaproteobacteria bacterium]